MVDVLRGNLADMEREERRRRVSAYVSARLTDECRGRGDAARIARATGYTTAHVSKVRNGLGGVGDDFLRAIAAYWRMSVAELEDEALKRPWSPTPRPGALTARAIVRSSPEYVNASAAVRAAYDSLTPDAPMSVVGWALELDRLIEWERRGWPLGTQHAADSAHRSGPGKA